MPYIPAASRTKLDGLIDRLAESLVAEAQKSGYDAAFAGLLNYACTSLALKVVRHQFGQMRYWLIAILTGTFKNIADEFYRRLGAPYEDQQMIKNGDLDLYKQYGQEIAGR
jgi:hypothetical protein